MKKRFIALILSLCLLTSFAFPAFAAEDDISDADITAVFDAYTALDTAFDTKFITNISAALTDFTEIIDIINEMSEDDFAQLGELMGCDGDEAFSRLLAVNVDANILVEVNKRYSAYIADSNAKNSLSLVEYYDSIFNDPDYVDIELRELVRNVFECIDSVYDEAKEDLPPADILAVFDAYNALEAAFDSYTIEEVDAALGDFNEVIDIINDMDEAEFAQLGELLGCDEDEAFIYLLSANINANVLTEVNNRINAFSEEAGPGTAFDFVSYYNDIFNSDEYTDEELRQLVRDFFPFIDDVFAEAKAALPAKEILDVYDVYLNLAAALETWIIEELEPAHKEFEKHLDTINAMNDKEYKQLSELMDCSPDKVFPNLSKVHNYASVIIGANTAFNTFCENPTVANANAFIKIYDDIYNTPSNSEEELQTLVSSFVFGIEEGYAAALGVSPSADFTRFNGKGRVETAIAISGACFTSAKNVILASGDDFADALAGVPLAYALDAPILLIRNHTLSAETLDELKRLGAENVYILGGDFAVNAKVEETLVKKGYKVTRLAGDDRFGTSLEIAKKLQSVSGSPDEIFFVYSHNYPDALSISSVASLKGSPILYIGANGILKDSIAEFVKAAKADSAVIISGPAIVSGSAEGSIKKAGIDKVERIYGATRYDTCIDINTKYRSIFGGDAICVATGMNYPDALAGGVFAAKNAAPMLLADGSLSAKQVEYLKGNDADRIYVFGGTGVVSDKLAAEIAKY